MMMREAMVIMVSRQAFFASPTVRRLRYLCTCVLTKVMSKMPNVPHMPFFLC